MRKVRNKNYVEWEISEMGKLRYEKCDEWEIRNARNESEKWEAWAIRKKWAMEMKMWEMINEKCEKLQIWETGNGKKWE